MMDWKKLNPFKKKFKPRITLEFICGYEANSTVLEDQMNEIYAPTFLDADNRYVGGKLKWAFLGAFHIFETVTPSDYWGWDYQQRCEWEKKLSDILIEKLGRPKDFLGKPPTPGLDRDDVVWE